MSLWRHLHPTWTFPMSPAPRDCALTGGLDWMISRDPFQPQQFWDSVIINGKKALQKSDLMLRCFSAL